MRVTSSSRKTRRQGGVSLLVACIALTFVIPMIGLVIDVGVLYVVRSRLQASVDGAALAAARALNLGQSTAAQADNAKQNAVNWFYSNFPSSNWATTNTQMTRDSVNVFDDPVNPNLRNVTIEASTVAPTYFMKWFSANSVTVKASGNASRRDVVAVMILDRSGSMCAPGSTGPCTKANTTKPCAGMISAAKGFVSNFAAGRDRIGLVTFSDGAIVHAAPATDFQTTLPSIIDGITCVGGTGTSSAISLAYNELYKTALPGALNLLVLETDGLPNTVAYNFWDGASFAIENGSGCLDADNKTKAASGWGSYAKRATWTSGIVMNPAGKTGYMADIPSGVIGSIYAGGTENYTLYNPIQTAYASRAALGPGCKWQSGINTSGSATADLDWVPTTDIFGSSSISNSPYKTFTYTGTKIYLAHDSTDFQKTNFAALNITDNAAFQARTNANIPAQIFTIGLGGNGTVDHVLLQRIANDPSPSAVDCATATGCKSYPGQPIGAYIYAPSTADLGAAFQKVAAQVLRLSK